MLVFDGVCASAGLAMGPLAKPQSMPRIVRQVSTKQSERERCRAAINVATAELQQLQNSGRGDADIFLFQEMLLEDASLLEDIERQIAGGCGAADAVENAAMRASRRLAGMDNDYMRLRDVDVLDACRRVADILDGRSRRPVLLQQPSILAADHFMPSDLLKVERGMVLGLVAARDSLQSHAAIMARMMNLPCLVRLGTDFLQKPNGTLVVLDADAGKLTVEPDSARQAAVHSHLARQAADRARTDPLMSRPCVMRDGTPVELLCSGSGPEDIENSLRQGADGIGLIRSESLLMVDRLPGEEEQYYFYRSCLAAAKGKPMYIQAFDVGADKRIPGLTLAEGNPALGTRGMRMGRLQPELYIAQLCALLRAGREGPLHISFPLVSSAADWQRCLNAVETAKKQLEMRNVPFARDVQVGLMVEVPSCALEIEDILELGGDFVQIGTSDLIQYTCAADRMEPALDRYYREDSKAVQKLVRMVTDEANRRGLPVSILGGAISKPELALLYVRMGLRSLCMDQTYLRAVKSLLNGASLSEEN